MSKKIFLIISILTVLFSSMTLTNAQEKPSEKKDMQTMMQNDDMQNCMDKIAADSTMRMQMMDKMLMHTKGDNRGMMQMCKMMMNNPEMMKMMMKMMQGEGMIEGEMMKHNMMGDSTKIMQKSEHESHQHKK